MANNFEQDFAAALANLRGSGNYNPLPQVRPMQFQVPEYKPLDMGAGMVSPSGYSSPGAAGAKDSYWSWGGLGMDLAHALGGVGTIITDTIASATDGNASTIPLLNWVGLVGKGQYEAWTDGKVTIADIPIIGGLIGAGKHGKTTHDILENLGWKEAEADPNAGWNFFQHRKGNFDIGDVLEFVGDVLLDPTTYVTFGGASAIKAGVSAAGKAAIKEVGEQVGKQIIRDATTRGLFGITTDVGKIADNVAGAVLKKTGDDVAAQIARNNVLNAANTARATAQNALISFDVPFTNITKQFGTKPGFLKVTDNVIGQIGKAPIMRQLTELGLDESAQRAFLKSAYGVDDASQMTSQMAEHFAQNIGKVSKAEDLVDVFKPVTDEMITYNPFSPDNILKTITDPTENTFTRNMFETLANTTRTSPEILGRASTSLLPDLAKIRTELPQILGERADELLRYADEAPGMVDDGNILQSIDELLKAGDEFAQAGHTAEIGFAPFEQATIKVPNMGKTLEEANKVFNINRFAQDMGGSSQLGRWFGRSMSALNPRSLGSADNFINEAAGKIRDAENFMRSNQGWTERELRRIQKLASGLSQDDLAKIPYILEGKAPGGKTMEQFLEGVTNRAQLQQVADYLKNMFETQAGREVVAGALDPKRVLENYFPHVLNKEGMSKDALQALLADPEMSKYLGRSASNVFNQSRKGFESFAQWDDAIMSLQQALKTETDPEKIAKITQALDQLQNLFIRDPIQAAAQRMFKGIRAEAMSQLYSQLRQMGTIRLPDDIAKDGALALGKDFKRLDKELADKLGLPVGTAIHKEVLQGLQKMPNLFTDAGINRFVENMTSAMNIWKNLVTTYKPAHHFTNLMGNVANTTLAGVKPESYELAGKLLWKVRNGTLNEAEMRFIREAVDKGIIGGGQLLDVIDPLRYAQKGGTIQKIERAVANTRWAKAWRRVGDTFEDLSRLALYIHGKKTTGSARLAADMVRKYLFNYGELTNADRIIKLGAPFWMWTKNNLPLQLMEFMRQPRYMTTLKKLQDQLNRDDQDSTLAPEYVQRNYFRVPGTDTFMSPRIPAFDAINFLDHPLDTLTGLLTPVAKVPIELQMNKQMFNGAPIDPTYTDRLGYSRDALWKYGKQQTGVIGEGLDLLTPDSGQDFFDSLAGLIFSKPVHVDPQKEARNQMYQRKADQKAIRKRQGR